MAFLQAAQIAGAEISVRTTRRKYVECGDQDLMGNCHRGSFAPATRSQAIVLVSEITALGVRGGDGGLDQGCAEMHVALPDSRTHTSAGAFVVARTHPRPCRRVPRAVEDRHVGPKFRHDDGRGYATDPPCVGEDLALVS